MQNIPSELIFTVKNYINITSFKMKGSPDLGQADMTLFYCTTDQVRVSSICVNFCGSYGPFGTFNTGNTQFSALFSYMLLHIELEFFILLC